VKPQSRVPIVTLLLLGANLAAAFAVALDPDLVSQFGFSPSHPSAFTVVSCLFLQENVVHLLGNLVFLAAAGASVELATGSLRFSLVYLLSGIVGVLAYWAFSHRGGAVLIGSSGAVAGCAAYYTARYTTLRVPLAPKVSVPVLAVTLIWLGLQVVGAFVRIGDAGSGPISFWSHVGGFATGLLLCLVFWAPDRGERHISREVIQRMAGRSPAAALSAAEQHLKRHPDDRSALAEMADSLEMLGDEARERGALLRLLELTPEAEQDDILARLGKLGGLGALPSLQRRVTAERLAAREPGLARTLLRSVIEGPRGDAQRPDAILALAALERGTDDASAGALLRQLGDEYPLHAATELARARGWMP